MFLGPEFLFLFNLSLKIMSTTWFFLYPHTYIILFCGFFFSLLRLYFHILGNPLKKIKNKIPETPKELSEGLDQNQMCKLVQHDNFWQNLLIEIMVSPDENANLLFGQAALTEQKQRHLEIHRNKSYPLQYSHYCVGSSKF